MTSQAYKQNYDAIDWSGVKPISRWRHSVPKARGDFPLPMFQRDWDEPVEHPVTGEQFTSKAAFSRRTKELGYVEYGNDPSRYSKPTPKKASDAEIKDAISQAESLVSQGFNPAIHTPPDR